jgi:hypothetical protein
MQIYEILKQAAQSAAVTAWTDEREEVPRHWASDGLVADPTFLQRVQTV